MRIAQINFGALENVTLGNELAGREIGDVIYRITLYLFPIAGLVLLLYLIYGGYVFLISGGNPKRIQDAKGVISNAIVGFIIIFIAYWIVQILGVIFGLDPIVDIFSANNLLKNNIC